MANRTAVLVLLFATLALCGSATTPEPGTRLANKTVVGTGASSVFGRGIAFAHAGRDANVVVAARNTPALEQLVRESGSDRMLVVTTDVGKSEERIALEDIARRLMDFKE